MSRLELLALVLLCVPIGVASVPVTASSPVVPGQGAGTMRAITDSMLHVTMLR